MRILLFTGKGGVGKTTAAAATALCCADAGLRTMVLSTDPAHSLADAFDLELGSVGTPIADRLWGQQLDAQERMEDAWADIQKYLIEVFAWAGVEGIEAEELSVLPGLDEVFSLSDIKAYADSGEWDVIVVDCAPTVETIRFLSLPDILSWYMTRVFPAGRRLNRLVSPILSRVTQLPVAGDEVFGSARRFYDRLDGVRELLTDTTRTSVRLVVNPERMVIAEARRTYTYLSLFGYGVDAVIANRLLPDAVTDPWFAHWRELQAGHMATIEEGFSPLPVLQAELAAEELVGLERLRGFGERLYGDLDPASVLHEGSPMEVRHVGDHVELAFDLPFADRDDLELGRRQDELLIRVGPHRRAVMLPDSLRRKQVRKATLRRGRLRVTFDRAERTGGIDRGKVDRGQVAVPSCRGGGAMTTSAGPSGAQPDETADRRAPVEDAAARGIEALQAAAHDMIEAAKALLDVADDLVGDPRTVGDLLSALNSVVVTPLREGPRGDGNDAGGEDQHDDDDDDDGRVQRIPVS